MSFSTSDMQLFLFNLTMFQAPLYHVIFEVLLILLIVKIYMAQSFSTDKTILTEKVGHLVFCLFYLLDVLDGIVVLTDLTH